MSEAPWVTGVLAFWFEELKRADWFRKDDATDRTIKSRYLETYETVAATPLPNLTGDARTALAAVIALDQFPRNLFRGTPRSFATDARAREIANAAIAKRLDAEHSPDRRIFLYLPFEHSENAEDQGKSVSLISALGDTEFTRYALAHAEVITRFGRFPHRNEILGRPSTPEEETYLKEPGSGF